MLRAAVLCGRRGTGAGALLVGRRGCAEQAALSYEARISLTEQLQRAARRKDVEEAERLLRKFTTTRTNLRATTHSEVIELMSSRGIYKAVEAYHAIPSPSARALHTVLERVVERFPSNAALIKRVFEEIDPLPELISTQSHWLIFRLYCTKDHLEDALAHFNRYEELRESAKFLVPLARLYLKRGETEAATELAKQLPEAEAQEELVQNFRTEVLAFSGDLPKVLQNIRKHWACNYTLNYILAVYLKKDTKDFKKFLDGLKSMGRVLPQSVVHATVGEIMTLRDYDMLEWFMEWSSAAGVPLDRISFDLVAVNLVVQNEKERLNQFLSSLPPKTANEIRRSRDVSVALALREIQHCAPIHASK